MALAPQVIQAELEEEDLETAPEPEETAEQARRQFGKGIAIQIDNPSAASWSLQGQLGHDVPVDVRLPAQNFAHEATWAAKKAPSAFEIVAGSRARFDLSKPSNRSHRARGKENCTLKVFNLFPTGKGPEAGVSFTVASVRRKATLAVPGEQQKIRAAGAAIQLVQGAPALERVALGDHDTRLTILGPAGQAGPGAGEAGQGGQALAARPEAAAADAASVLAGAAAAGAAPAPAGAGGAGSGWPASGAGAGAQATPAAPTETLAALAIHNDSDTPYRLRLPDLERAVRVDWWGKGPKAPKGRADLEPGKDRVQEIPPRSLLTVRPAEGGAWFRIAFSLADSEAEADATAVPFLWDSAPDSAGSEPRLSSPWVVLPLDMDFEGSQGIRIQAAFAR